MTTILIVFAVLMLVFFPVQTLALLFAVVAWTITIVIYGVALIGVIYVIAYFAGGGM